MINHETSVSNIQLSTRSLKFWCHVSLFSVIFLSGFFVFKTLIQKLKVQKVNSWAHHQLNNPIMP